MHLRESDIIHTKKNTYIRGLQILCTRGQHFEALLLSPEQRAYTPGRP